MHCNRIKSAKELLSKAEIEMHQTIYNKNTTMEPNLVFLQEHKITSNSNQAMSITSQVSQRVMKS